MGQHWKFSDIVQIPLQIAFWADEETWNIVHRVKSLRFRRTDAVVSDL
jgi:hypothetical protein